MAYDVNHKNKSSYSRSVATSRSRWHNRTYLSKTPQVSGTLEDVSTEPSSDITKGTDQIQ
jgi:hypothetical protein